MFATEHTFIRVARSLRALAGDACIDSAPPEKGNRMLHYALVFLVIALIAGVLGFGGLAGASIGIAKVLFLVFIVLFVVSLLLGRRRGL